MASSSQSPNLYTASNPPPFQSQTRVPIVHFATRDVSPPSEVYVTINDYLLVNAWNSAPNGQLEIMYKLLRADGQIVVMHDTQYISSDRSQNEFKYALPEGFLLCVTIGGSVVRLLRGQCFASVAVARTDGLNEWRYQTIVCDYITKGQPVCWPGGRIVSSVEGSGLVHLVADNIGSSATLYTLTPPTNARWRLIAVYGLLTTSAVVGNREPWVQIDSGGNSVLGLYTSVTTPASTFMNAFIAQFGAQPANVVPSVYFNLPAGVYLTNTVDLSLHCNSFAGDTWNPVTALVEEWIEITS